VSSRNILLLGSSRFSSFRGSLLLLLRNQTRAPNTIDPFSGMFRLILCPRSKRPSLPSNTAEILSDDMPKAPVVPIHQLRTSPSGSVDDKLLVNVPPEPICKLQEDSNPAMRFSCFALFGLMDQHHLFPFPPHLRARLQHSARHFESAKIETLYRIQAVARGGDVVYNSPPSLYAHRLRVMQFSPVLAYRDLIHRADRFSSRKIW